MDPQPAFTFQDLFTSVVADMAKAVSERSGEPQEQQFVRSRNAAHMLMGFLPRDVPEAILAGHCVMLHEIMTANVHTTLCTDAEPVRRGADGSVTALNKAFNDTLDRLWRQQKRPAEGSRDMPEQQPAAPRDDALAASRLPPADSIDPPLQTQTDTSGPQPAPVAPRLNRAARRQAARAESRAAAVAARGASRPASGVFG